MVILFFGLGAIVLSSTTLGDNVITGSGCVVAKDIRSNSVVIGNPPYRVVCSYDEFIEREKDEIKNGLKLETKTEELFYDKRGREALERTGKAYFKNP